MESTVSLRGDHPAYELLVWQGELGGVTARVRIVIWREGEEPWTVVEKWACVADQPWRWIEYNAWGEPSTKGVGNNPTVAFVEAMIDLMGRPEWDKRTPAKSLYPYALGVQVCKDDVIAKLQLTLRDDMGHGVGEFPIVVRDERARFGVGHEELDTVAVATSLAGLDLPNISVAALTIEKIDGKE